MNNQDVIYVVYFNNKMFIEHGRKCAYLKESYAKAVVTSEVRRIAHEMYDENNLEQCWHDLGEENKQEWLDKARQRYKICNLENWNNTPKEIIYIYKYN